MIRDNTMTVARICVNKWPRILTVRMAAAYCCEASEVSFRNSPFANLIWTSWSGRNVVDREALDIALTEWIKNHDETGKERKILDNPPDR